MFRGEGRTLVGAMLAGVAMAGLAGLAGCTLMPLQSTSSQEPSPKLLDALVAAYPEDLASKKFQIIADFEDPRQGQLFRREPDRSPEAVGITTARAVRETGVGSLKMTFSNASQQVVVADTPEAEWALHQDWAPYHLLLLNVFSPRDQGGFRFSVRSGTTTPLVYEHPRIFLKTGWNHLRIDLADVAEQVYLGDVREMRFWCDPLDSPIDLYLDDIILADNTRVLMDNPTRAAGELSVRSQGRRIVVTAAERFELVFSRGRIRQWFDLAADPQRMHNLAGGGCLGPLPVVIAPDGSVREDPAQWNPLGPLAESYQGLVESSPLRVVVHGEWRFGSPESPVSESSPYHRWVYSIYRGGEVFVECSGSIPGMETANVGVVFGSDGAAGFVRQTRPGADDVAHGIPYVLFSQPPQAGGADLLVIPSKPLILQALENPEQSRVCALYRLPLEGDSFLFAGQMRVWPPDIDGPAQAGPMALAYARPLPIKVDVGQLVRTDAGDFDGDGYSEARGYYVLQLDGRVAKVRLDGREHLRFSPAFKLVDVADHDVWVYVDGRQIKQTPRDQNGNLLFEIPGVISREVLIEVIASRRTDTAG
ncbi:MAG TPA: hypothetical protein PL151_09760 [Phycisphaerae bacterium]|nr:hypothetical protein [Phycisphaerae bacterium]HOM53527.1 hypothetical protein [Phycisphaerae bacterium]HON65223.1 hypothetical protein [Phycisphaerae bacterium]HOQ86630.1 hypothetical protein [Phycisphaerae bacterium]HPP28808.1 hypothetical protein [Phycisphaerae bacterium]